MLTKIIGMAIGALVLGAGIYYLVKEGHDAESKKIYSIVTAAGAVILIASLLLLFLA